MHKILFYLGAWFKDKPIEIQVNRGTMQDVMAELSKENDDGEFINTSDIRKVLEEAT